MYRKFDEYTKRYVTENENSFKGFCSEFDEEIAFDGGGKESTAESPVDPYRNGMEALLKKEAEISDDEETLPQSWPGCRYDLPWVQWKDRRDAHLRNSDFPRRPTGTGYRPR